MHGLHPLCPSVAMGFRGFMSAVIHEGIHKDHCIYFKQTLLHKTYCLYFSRDLIHLTFFIILVDIISETQKHKGPVKYSKNPHLITKNSSVPDKQSWDHGYGEKDRQWCLEGFSSCHRVSSSIPVYPRQVVLEKSWVMSIFLCSLDVRIAIF